MFKIINSSLLTGLLFISSTAFCAETATGVLPYENWLSMLQKSLTGPVAFSVSLIGIVSCGATLIFAGGEIGRFLRSLIYIVLVMTLLVGSNSLMTRFFNGAVIADTSCAPHVCTYPDHALELMSHAKDRDDELSLILNGEQGMLS